MIYIYIIYIYTVRYKTGESSTSCARHAAKAVALIRLIMPVKVGSQSVRKRTVVRDIACTDFDGAGHWHGECGCP